MTKNPLYLVITFAFLCLSNPITTSAQSNISHPGQGTPERKLILDGMRSTTESQLKIPDVQYSVKTINVMNDWAYVAASAQRKDGKRINPKEVCAYEIHGDRCITDIESVLRKNNGIWKVDSYVAGATDVWQQEYCSKKDFPFEVLGAKRSEMCPSGVGQSMPPVKRQSTPGLDGKVGQIVIYPPPCSQKPVSANRLGVSTPTNGY